MMKIFLKILIDLKRSITPTFLFLITIAANAQLSIAPPFEVSACNTDSVVVSFTNSLGTAVTVGDVTTLKVVLPGDGLIKYDSGSLRVYNFAASTASGYSDTVEISFPLPPIGETLNFAFDVNAECDVPSLSTVSLPVINGEITYPTGYAIASESVTTNEFNCVAAQLVLQVSSSYLNHDIPKERNAWRVIPILNGGYGNIDEFFIVDTSDADIVFIPGTQRIYENASGSVYNSITYTTDTIANGRIIRTYKVTSEHLGADGIFTPNEYIRLYQRIRLDTCAQFNSSITTYFRCDENAPICGSPDYVQASVYAHGGVPNLELAVLQADSADGCPNKHIELAYYNAGTVYSGVNDLSMAKDVKLRFEFESQSISNLKLNNQVVTYSETNGIVEIDLGQFSSSFGPLENFDLDGTYNDLPVGDTLFLEFDYTTKCEEACGANAYSRLMNRATYEDLCGFAKSKSQMAYELGFRQLSPVSNEPPVNYTCRGDGTYDTLSHKWAMDFEAINYKLDGVTGEIIIRFAKNMNFDSTSVKLNNSTLTPTMHTDSAVVSLTNAEVIAFLNAGRDSLEYATELICDTTLFRSGATGLQDNFSFILFLDSNGGCNPGCQLDLTCNAVTAYGYDPCCGTGCLYDHDSLIVGRLEKGSTDLSQTTDTLATNQNLWVQDTLVIKDYFTTRSNGYGSRTESRFIYSPYYYYDQTDLSMQFVPPFLFVSADIIVNGTDTLPFTMLDRNGWSNYAYNYNSTSNTTYDHFATTCVGAPNNGTCLGNEFTTGIQYGGGQDDWLLGPNFGYRVWGIDTVFHRFNNQLNVNQAIERAGITIDYFQAGNTFDFIMKYIPNPDFNWTTIGNIGFRSSLTSYTKQTTNNIGSCGTLIDNITIVDPKVYIDNPYETYNNSCGLSVNHDIQFEGFNGDYFTDEYRFPYRIDSIVMDIPTEYGIVSGTDSFYNHNNGSGTWNQPGTSTFSRSAANGHVVWTGNLTDGFFPKSDDESGYQLPIRVNYDLQKLGSAPDSSYTIPVTFYGKDDYGNVKIYYDTIKVTEDNPVIDITPLSPVVTVSDGGDCEEAYMDFEVCNNSIYTASNLFLAAESFNGTTINSITDKGTVSFNPLVSGVDTAYGTNKLFQPLGTLREGECRDIRVNVSIYNCSDSIRLYADYGCEFPSPRMPDYASTTIDSGTGEFNTFTPAIQTKTQPLATDQTYCDTVTAEIELLNTKLPNLYNIESEIDFPAGVEVIASSLEYQYNGSSWRAIPTTAVDRGGYVGGNYQDSALINWNQVSTAEFIDDCGLPGADDNPENNVKIRYDFVFVGCMPNNAVIQYNTSAETFCGVVTSYQSVSNIITVNSEAPNPKNDFTISSSASPELTICSALSTAGVVYDTLTITNNGGFGAESGTTNGSDSIEVVCPLNNLAFTTANFAVNDASFGTPRVYTNAAGAAVAKMVIPSGLIVGNSISLPFQYDLTLLNYDHCGTAAPYQAKVFTYNSNGCAAKSIVCDITEDEMGSDVIARTINCCLAELGDKVWNDLDADGSQDSDEAGVAGVTVTLFNSTGDIVGTTVTDAYGNYKFTDLEPGDYSVGFTLPPTYEFTSSTGSDDTNAANSDANPLTGQTGTINLVRGESELDVDAGIIKTIVPALSSIGDRVWFDDDSDGVQDAGENGVGGVTVTLYDNSGNVIAITTTDASGNYLFNDLPNGSYTVGFEPPAGTTLTSSSGTTSGDNTDSDADATTGKTSTITIAAAGTQITGIDAGLINDPKSSIGDRVWNDLDQDGIQDSGEVGVQGVKMILMDPGPDGIVGTADDVTLDSTYTNAVGHYHFSGLDSGDYFIQAYPPSGYTVSPDTVGSDEYVDNDFETLGGIYTSPMYFLKDNQDYGGVDLGIYNSTASLGSLGDKVWLDTNGDGIQDAGETGLQGITVSLLDNTGSPINNPATGEPYIVQTDENGNYLFVDLPAGNYKVKFDNLPENYSFSAQTQGGDTDKDSDVDPETGETGVISLAAGQDRRDIDAGINPVTQNGKGSLGNKVWIDADDDGIQDAGEQGIAGVRVNLYEDTNGDGNITGGELTPVNTVLTDAMGNYIFTDLDKGNYQVGFDATTFPSGYSLTSGNNDVGSDDNVDSDADPTTGKSPIIALAQGEDNMSIDAGIYNSSATNSIGNKVWLDANADGVQDAGEAGVPYVVVNLIDASGVIISSVETDIDGNYLFDNLPNGDYSIQVVKPSGFDYTTPNGVLNGANSATNSDVGTDGKTEEVTLSGGTNITDLDAGLTTTQASLGDRVWFDTDNDGVQDAGEAGVPGVTVNLYRPGFGPDGIAGNGDDADPVASTVTDGDGNYWFPNLTPGTYDVEFTDIPTGYGFTEQDATAATDGTDSDADVGTGIASGIVLAAGDINPTVDAGLVFAIPGTVGDFVWFDEDGDGIQDADEVGIPGIKVTLKDADGNVVGITYTDGVGGYLFTDVTPGDGYTIEFETPNGEGFTTAGAGSGNDDSDANGSGVTGSFSVTSGGHTPNIDAGITTYTPVPVTWLTFTAVKHNGNQVLVSWTTATEINADRYEVERSEDRINWTVIGTEQAIGNTTVLSNYSLVDRNPNKHNFYRIRQVDFDNQFTLTDTRYVRFENNITTVVYPNPSRDIIHVKLSKETEIENTIELIDELGRTHISISTDNTFSSLDISSLSAGVYYIKVNGELFKFVKI